MADAWGVLGDFTQKSVVQPPALRPHTVSRSLGGIVEKSKKLGIAVESTCADHINMSVVAVQRFAGFEASCNGVTMGVKIMIRHIAVSSEENVFCKKKSQEKAEQSGKQTVYLRVKLDAQYVVGIFKAFHGAIGA